MPRPYMPSIGAWCPCQISIGNINFDKGSSSLFITYRDDDPLSNINCAFIYLNPLNIPVNCISPTWLEQSLF